MNIHQQAFAGSGDALQLLARKVNLFLFNLKDVSDLIRSGTHQITYYPTHK